MIRKHINFLIYIAVMACVVLCAGCADGLFGEDGAQHSTQRIELSGEIVQEAVTRVNDGGFCDGDGMGIYIVDYKAGTPGTLQQSGNRADNVCYTYDEANRNWNSDYDVYWKDFHTHIDVYGYYPYAKPESVDNYTFMVQRDQSTVSSNGKMGGYEASDFLWGKLTDVAPTSAALRLLLRHRMSNACVKLVKGEGFTDSEWESVGKIVFTTNLARKASINMKDGTVKVAGSVETSATIPSQVKDEWRTIVVPQTVPAGTTLFSITIGGVPYKFAKNEALTYVSGKMMKFAIRVDKIAGSGKYQLTLVSESIAPWENDLVSHDATAKEYVIINSTAGHLKDSIAASHKDLTKVKHLKVTGTINAQDFFVMRDRMPKLTAINLRDVRIKSYSNIYDDDYYCGDDELPREGLAGMNRLTSFVFPTVLKRIGNKALINSGLTGSLNIPEGVEEIGRAAFGGNDFTGILTLPSTLKKIEEYAFAGLNFVCRMYLPDGIEELGANCFEDCQKMYGRLILPSHLKTLGSNAFNNCKVLQGGLVIPKSLTVIPDGAFNHCGLEGRLLLHDGITSIGDYALAFNEFRGEIALPKSLTELGSGNFTNNNFLGNVKIPKGLLSISEKAFEYCSFREVEIPEGVTYIHERAFAGSKNLQKVILPSTLEFIDKEAFSDCDSLRVIECKSLTPPYDNGAFYKAPWQNITVMVPESAVKDYKSSSWSFFENICAIYKLKCSPSEVSVLNKESKHTITLDTDGKWEVESKPDWCEVSPSSGNRKTEVTVTVRSMAKGSGDRSGKVVFCLKDKGYTSECIVSQYDCGYDEDQWVCLQKATKGNNGGINVVLLGDGFDAKSIADDSYMSEMKSRMDGLFKVEPFKRYSNYFNVYTAIPVACQSSSVTKRETRFNTTYVNGSGLTADYDKLFNYVLTAPTVNKGNLKQTLIILTLKTAQEDATAANCHLWEDGSTVAMLTHVGSLNEYIAYVGGFAFGKLADETVIHENHIGTCKCTCCPHVSELRHYQSLGWFENISLTSNAQDVPWSVLLKDKNYNNYVDIYEGGYMHGHGVFRSEKYSCMADFYFWKFNAASRMSIVKRIKSYAGETFSYSDFVRYDIFDNNSSSSKASNRVKRKAQSHKHVMVIHKGSPLRR